MAVALCALSCGTGGGAAAGPGSDGGPGARAADGAAGCATDADCAASVPPTTPAGCASGKCNVLQGVCEYVAKDEDGDGHPAASCRSTSGVAIQVGDDCNDQDPGIYPGRSEACSTTPDGGTLAGTPCVSGQRTCLPD